MRKRISRQSDLSTHDQIEYSSSSRNRQRRLLRLLESLDRRENRLRTYISVSENSTITGIDDIGEVADIDVDVGHKPSKEKLLV